MIDYSKFKKNLYTNAKPYPHIVIDDLFDVNFTNSILSEFPQKEKVFWWQYDNVFEKKLAYNNIEKIKGENIKKYFDIINSEAFVKQLEKLTGISNIQSDSSLFGGGLHKIERGGKLDIHADFQFHRKIKNLRRKLNIITYLNKDWKEEYNGHLELWDKDMQACVTKILPIFNRTVIFYIDEYSYHGHPNILTCPVNMSRKSLASYYYVKCSESEVNKFPASTCYKKRPNDESNEIIESLRLKRSQGRLE